MKIRKSFAGMKAELAAQLRAVRGYAKHAKGIEAKSHWLRQERELKEALSALKRFSGKLGKFKSWVYLNNRVI
jgi:hypothetical protein